MKRMDGIRIAVSSLFENPLRSFLTLLGISISVTAVILVVSVIQGLDLYVASTVSELGSDSLAVSRFGIMKNHTEWVKAARRNKPLRNEDGEAIRRKAHLIKRVGLSREHGGMARFRSERINDVNVRGITADVQEIESLEIEEGRTLVPAETETASYACVLGYEVAQQLFAPLDPVGRSIQIWGRSFRVVGVAAKRGSSFGQSRDVFILIPLTNFEKIHGDHGRVTILAQAVSPARLEDAVEEVRGIMRIRHQLKPSDDDNFGILTSAGVMGIWRSLTSMIFGVAVFVVSISLVVGGIVIMNIMLLTVVERTREIGVRKAIGARNCDIRFQFMVESIFLCAFGGLLGVLMGWALSWAVRTYTPLPCRFPLWAPVLAVFITSAVGIFFGIYPARQAAKLDPIEALRAQTT
jgi:putative ABC transport system permease protein